MPVTRAGATLAEMAIALVLAGLAAAAGAGLLMSAERRARADAASDQAAQVDREVAWALGTDIAGARAASVVTLGDTAIEFESHVGLSVVCATGGAEAVLPATTTSAGLPFTTWRQPLEPADVVAIWDSSAAGRWQTAAVVSVGTATDGAGCRVGPFRTAADSAARVPVTRVRLDAALAAGVGIGAPVRAFRRVRWVLYRGGDGAWWLGLRRCPRGICAAPQPVTGPLAAPRDSGFRATLGPDGAVRIAFRVMTGAGATAARRREITVRGARPDAP